MTRQIAIITGTSAGIGEALADRLLNDGWRVIGIARRPVEKLEPTYQHIQSDLGDLDDLVGSLLPSLEKPLRARLWGRMALINNAASIGQLRDIERSDPRVLASTITTNTVAPTALMSLIARICPTGVPLRVVNISTGLAHRALAGCGDYCISKAGLHMAGQVFVEEQQKSGAHQCAVMSYSPGSVATNMQQTLRSQSANDFSSAGVFKQRHSEDQLVPAESVLQPIISFLNAVNPPSFTSLP